MKLLFVSAALCLGCGPALGGVLRGRSPAGEDSVDLCSSVIAVALTPDRAGAPLRATEGGGRGREEEFVCESNGRVLPIRGTRAQMEELRLLLERGLLVSADDTVEVLPDARLPPGKVLVKKGAMGRGRGRGNASGGRYLALHEGMKSVLVVRVTDVDGRAHPDSADDVSDKVFGTHGDGFTMKSQLEACSFGKFQASNEYAVDISAHLAAPGVVDVKIPISLVGNDRVAIENAVRLAVEEKLGVELPGPFQHVMFILERCYTDCGWAAYAYVNGWLSAYVGNNYKYPAVAIHEIGHNMNFGHSGGMDGLVYSDLSCQMGNPWYSDDEGAMCFNPAKSFQLVHEAGWYNENEYDTAVWDSGTSGGGQWAGKVVGIADYRNNPNSRPVVVKLESGGPDDLFLGFNRAIGIVRDAVAARDQVTVIEAGNDGLTYSQSFVKAILSEGDSYVVPDWRGSGLSMIIHVKAINLVANPCYADVTMSLGVACGNNVCELGETPSNCAHDCSGKQLVTTVEHDLGGSVGNMFLIKATCDIEVTSLYISTSVQGDGAVRVYTREGTYAGHERSADGWNIIYSNTVSQMGMEEPTFLGNLLTHVIVQAGAYQSFYVVADAGLVYSRGTQEFNAFTSNDCIQLYEGSSMAVEFGQEVAAPRVWNGIIRYNVLDHITAGPTNTPTYFPTSILTTASPTYLPTTSPCGDQYCGADENSSTCPSDCIDKVLETTWDYDSGSHGNMFVVKSRRDVSITSLSINTMTRGVGEVKVYTREGTYTGHERSTTGWKLIYDNASTQMKGRGRPTTIDGFEAVTIESGEYQAFYVCSEQRLVYKRGFLERMPYASDDSLIIFEGIGVKDHFGPVVYSPRVWSGGIAYETSVL